MMDQGRLDLGFIPLVPLMLALGLATACASAAENAASSQSPAALNNDTAGPRSAATDEPLYQYNKLLGRDSIRPVYEPEFVPAGEAPLEGDELVLGIEIDGQAKAYPISVLNFREMVNDELAGVPILATW